jgi:ABC-2 type transport system permease protein
MAELISEKESHLWTLLKLQAKLTVRQFSREKGRIIGAFIVLLVFGPLIVSAAVGTTIGYRSLSDQWPTALLGGVLVVMWFIWLLFPIIGSALNETADITKLLIYPISRRDLVGSILLGTLFDYPTYLMLPLFIAIFIGFGLSSIFPVVLLALLLAYGHMVLIGQFITLAIGGILQSRRFRDVTIIFFSLLGSSCYFINLGFQRFIESSTARFSAERGEAFSQSLAHWQPLNILQWFPSGAPARAIEQALQGAWLPALLWLFYSAALLALITWIWLRLLTRLATGEGFLIAGRPAAKPEKKKRAVQQTNRRDWLGWLPDDLAILILKEARSVWRTPQRRVGLLQGVLIPLFMIAPFLLSFDFSDGVSRLPDWIGLSFPLYALFLFWISSQNMLAWEGRGLPSLLLTPNPRWRLFVAKGITNLLVSGIPVLAFGLVLILLATTWVTISAVLTGLALGLTSLAVTAVASVLFPIPINLEAKGMRGSFQSGGNLRTGCATMTLVPFCIVMVGLPAILPLGLAYWLDLPWLAAVGVLLSMVYGTAVFYGGCRLAGSLLEEREPEMVAVMKLPDE